MKEVINTIRSAIVIILPKSITGFISENKREPKATIVVKAVYKTVTIHNPRRLS